MHEKHDGVVRFELAIFRKVLEAFKVEVGLCELGLDLVGLKVEDLNVLDMKSMALVERSILTFRASSCGLALVRYG